MDDTLQSQLVQVVKPVIITLYTGKQAYFYESTSPDYHTSDEVSSALGWLPAVGLRAIMAWFALEVDFSNASSSKEREAQLQVQSWVGVKRVQSRRLLYVLTRAQTEKIIYKESSALGDIYKAEGLTGVFKARIASHKHTSYIYMFLDTDTLETDNIVIKLGVVAEPDVYIEKVKRQSARRGLVVRKVSKTQFIDDTVNIVAKELLEKYKAYEIAAGWFMIPKHTLSTVMDDVEVAGIKPDVVIEVDEVPAITPVG